MHERQQEVLHFLFVYEPQLCFHKKQSHQEMTVFLRVLYWLVVCSLDNDIPKFPRHQQQL